MTLRDLYHPCKYNFLFLILILVSNIGVASECKFGVSYIPYDIRSFIADSVKTESVIAAEIVEHEIDFSIFGDSNVPADATFDPNELSNFESVHDTIDQVGIEKFVDDVLEGKTSFSPILLNQNGVTMNLLDIALSKRASKATMDKLLGLGYQMSPGVLPYLMTYTYMEDVTLPLFIAQQSNLDIGNERIEMPNGRVYSIPTYLIVTDNIAVIEDLKRKGHDLPEESFYSGDLADTSSFSDSKLERLNEFVNIKKYNETHVNQRKIEADKVRKAISQDMQRRSDYSSYYVAKICAPNQSLDNAVMFAKSDKEIEKSSLALGSNPITAARYKLIKEALAEYEDTLLSEILVRKAEDSLFLRGRTVKYANEALTELDKLSVLQIDKDSKLTATEKKFINDVLNDRPYSTKLEDFRISSIIKHLAQRRDSALEKVLPVLMNLGRTQYGKNALFFYIAYSGESEFLQKILETSARPESNVGMSLMDMLIIDFLITPRTKEFYQVLNRYKVLTKPSEDISKLFNKYNIQMPLFLKNKELVVK